MRRLSDAENGQKIGGPPGRAGRAPNAASFVSHIFQYAPSSFLAFGALPTRQIRYSNKFCVPNQYKEHAARVAGESTSRTDRAVLGL